MNKVEYAKWDTSTDVEDHLAVGDYKRVWAQLQEGSANAEMQMAPGDTMEARVLPYAVSVVDNLPLKFSKADHMDTDRALLMQKLESMMLECVPRRKKCERPTKTAGVGEGGGMDSDEEDGAYEEGFVGDFVEGGEDEVDEMGEEEAEDVVEDGGVDEDEEEEEEDEDEDSEED